MCFVLSRVVLCCVVSCHVMPALRCVVPYRVMSCRRHRVTSCHVGVIVSRHVMSALRCAVLYCVVSYRVTWCHVGVTLCCVVLCCAVSCHVMSCRRYVVLCCVLDNVLQDKNSWTRHLWHSAWYRTLSASPSQLKLLMPTTHLLFSISQVRLGSPLMFLVTMTRYRQLDSPWTAGGSGGWNRVCAVHGV